MGIKRLSMSVDRSDRAWRTDDGYAHHHQPQRKYEEYAYILDFTQRGKSSTVRGREGVIIQDWRRKLTLLELLGYGNATFEVGERLYIGRDGREKSSAFLETRNTLTYLKRLKTNCLQQPKKLCWKMKEIYRLCKYCPTCNA